MFGSAHMAANGTHSRDPTLYVMSFVLTFNILLKAVVATATYLNTNI